VTAQIEQYLLCSAAQLTSCSSPAATRQPRRKPAVETCVDRCARVAQMARAKIRGRLWPSPSQRAMHLWVVRTLEMHRERRLTCGTRKSITAETKKGLSTHKAPCFCSRAKTPTGQEHLPQPHSGSETRGPSKSNAMPVGRLWKNKPSQSKS
jgi:hypothetical protein